MQEAVGQVATLRLPTLYRNGIYAALSAAFTGVFFRATMSHAQQYTEIFSDFVGERPYQYRVFQPLVAHAIHAVLPVNVIAINLVLTAIAVYCVLIYFRRFLVRLDFGDQSDWAALAILYPMFWNYPILNLCYYPADIVSILAFLIGIDLLLSRRYIPYYLLFFLACVNRETACFISVAFALLLFGRMPWLRLAGHIAAQTAIWLIVRQTIVYIFRNNPGELHNTLRLNIEGITRLVTGHAPLYTFFALFTFGGLHWLVIPAYRSLPVLLKRLLLIVPIFLVPMFFVAEIFEVRIYNELVPIFAAVGVCWWREKGTFFEKDAVRVIL